MKLGRTKDEEYERNRILWNKLSTKQEKFAWFPVFCHNTQRRVWLERYVRQADCQYGDDIAPSYPLSWYWRREEIIK